MKQSYRLLTGSRKRSTQFFPTMPDISDITPAFMDTTMRIWRTISKANCLQAYLNFVLTDNNYILSVVSQRNNNITLLIQPVRKLFRAGCFFFDSLFPLQRFFLERFKRCQHFFQTVRRKAGCFLCLVDLVAPVLALVFVEQIIVVFSCPLVKLPLILKRLLLLALIAAQLVPLACCKENTPADFAFSEAQPPVIQAIQIVGYQRIKRGIGGNTFCCAPVVWIPEVKPCFRCRYGAENAAGYMERFWPAGFAVKLQRASLLEHHGLMLEVRDSEIMENVLRLINLRKRIPS